VKLQFKHQKFQVDAAKSVCDVFAGDVIGQVSEEQLRRIHNYATLMDKVMR
jgi:hypothetical protein